MRRQAEPPARRNPERIAAARLPGQQRRFRHAADGYQDSEKEMHSHLGEAVRAGLIFRSEDSYRFLHDRVQESAYSLIARESRAEGHLRIGMLLAEQTSQEKREEVIFEIVNPLNRGAHIIASVEEREPAAGLSDDHVLVVPPSEQRWSLLAHEITVPKPSATVATDPSEESIASSPN
jgi:predicted ATPase